MSIYMQWKGNEVRNVTSFIRIYEKKFPVNLSVVK